ncbi:hypothetical protein ElyMa_004166800 [Elysia marginata]|uniref:Uncharacterized protein n=1 Tax=Elysia marginata TaxID=1093978 RepID=A0AAV4GJB5_9GAST|nr:hypothetical protein ElyMa_004166800 [Elysia marginata]
MVSFTKAGGPHNFSHLKKPVASRHIRQSQGDLALSFTVGITNEAATGLAKNGYSVALSSRRVCSHTKKIVKGQVTAGGPRLLARNALMTRNS